MHVQLPGIVIAACRRRLMNPRRVRKLAFENLVVSSCKRAVGVREITDLVVAELIDGMAVSLRENHRLKGPHRPEGNDNRKMIVFTDKASAKRQLAFNVVEQHRPAVLFEVGSLAILFLLHKHRKAR